MHKHVGMLLIIGFGALFIVSPRTFDMLFALFFLGIVPNSTYVIPISIMAVVDILLLALVCYVIIRLLITASSPAKRDIMSRNKARQKILKKTNAHAKQDSRPKKRYLPIVEH